MTGSIALPLHPDVTNLAPLIGRWRGTGRGEYPTIESFEFGEEAVFEHFGKPSLRYMQRTWRVPGKEPLHTENGFLRARPGGTELELVVAMQSGVVELHEGTVVDGHIELATTLVARTASAKAVTEVRRVLDVDGDTLRYQLDMAAVEQPLAAHIEAELHRQ